MTIVEQAMREHAENLVQTIEKMLAAAAGSGGAFGRGMARGLEESLDAVRDELADYLPMVVVR